MLKIGFLEMLILSALVPGEAYGLKVIDIVEERTGGKKKISVGALYPTLHRMQKKKLIESRWGEETEERGGARRRYYKLTGHGIRALNEAQSSLQSLWEPFSPKPVEA